MSRQNIEVFERCLKLSNECTAQGRGADALAVLRALQVYVDVVPASADGTCRATVADLLETLQHQPVARRFR